jgi:hypothetical protein
MYFYIHKIYKYETNPNILLEMCHYTGFRIGDGAGIYGIDYTES